MQPLSAHSTDLFTRRAPPLHRMLSRHVRAAEGQGGVYLQAPSRKLLAHRPSSPLRARAHSLRVDARPSTLAARWPLAVPPLGIQYT